MIDAIIIFIVVAILAAAIVYVIKQKKQGKRCVGCPYAGECGKKDCGCTRKEDT